MNFERVYKLLCGDLFYTTDVDNNMKVGQQYIQEDLKMRKV